MQAFEGVCIARANKGVGSSFTVRKISFGEGVERVFPLYSPIIDKIEVVRRGDVRRAKLYYLRGRTGKAARIAERRDTRPGQGHGEQRRLRPRSARNGLKSRPGFPTWRVRPSLLSKEQARMSSGYRVAVVGATGNVGREMLNILAERQFPLDEVAAVASRALDRRRHRLRRQRQGAQGQEPRAFRFRRLGHRAVRRRLGGVEGTMRRSAAAAGCTVIDNSSLYRMDPDVPLIVPEVNPEAIDGYRKKNIIANPNCSTAQLVVALKPLHDAAKIKRVVVATYQSVSGAGKAGMDELFEQSRNIFVGDANEPRQVHQADRLQRHPAHRRLPRRRLDQGGMEDGGRDQEDPRPEDQGHRDLRPRAGVRRPFRSGQHRVRERDFRRRRRATILREAPGVMLVDKREDGGYVTPVECVGEYATYRQPRPRGPDRRQRPVAVGASATICARARR